MRSLVAGWKLLYHDRAAFKPDASKSAELNRGAYLVEGLAHCGSCHTPRNALGAEDKARAYAGADVQGWTAPALGASSTAAVPWTAERLADYLGKGRSPLHGVASGPMAPVIANLATVPEADIKAIATYVAALAGVSQQGAPGAGGPHHFPRPGRHRSDPLDSRRGARCRHICRRLRGLPWRGRPRSVRSRFEPRAVDVGPRRSRPTISFGLSSVASPNPAISLARKCPASPTALTDRQVSDLVEYVRANFTDRPAFAGVDVAIRTAR